MIFSRKVVSSNVSSTLLNLDIILQDLHCYKGKLLIANQALVSKESKKWIVELIRKLMKFLRQFTLIFSCSLFFTEAALASCIFVSRIKIKSRIQLADVTKSEVLRSYLNKCFSVEDLNKLSHDLTNAYIKKGYLTAYVEIPEQKPENNSLILDVKTGVIEKIECEDENIERNLSSVVGKAVDLREIEEIVENLNQLRSNNSRVEIKPGKGRDGSKLVILNEKSKNIFATLGIDNTNSEDKGRYMGFSSLTIENLLSKNDSLSISERHNLEAVGRHVLRNYNIIWTIPFINSYRVTFSYDYGFHKDEVNAAKQTLIYSGKHTRKGINLSKTLLRNKKGKLSSSFGFRKSNYLEKIDGLTLLYQTHKLSVLEAGFSYLRKFQRSHFLFGCSAEKGIEIEASKNDYSNVLHPVANFTKFVCNNSFSYQLINQSPLNLILSSNFKIQHSSDVLYSSEKFDLGGVEGVRGFMSNPMKGDRGYYFHNNLTYTPSSFLGFEKLFGKPRFFIGGDFGEFYNNHQRQGKKQFASSASIGVKTSGGMISTNLSFSKAMQYTNSHKPKKPESIYFSIFIEV